MYEIHIIRDKNHRDTGCRIDKESYEKYGTSMSIARTKEMQIDFIKPVSIGGMIGYTSSKASYTGIEQILREKCLLTDAKYEINFLDNPLKEFFPKRYSWTLPETEIIKIAAQHNIKLVFENQLSIAVDFLNPANALNVTLIDGYFDAEQNNYTYTVIPDYTAYKTSQEKIAEINEKWKDFKGEAYPKEYNEEICAACISIRPEDYDAGSRIYNALFALGCDRGWECWNVTYPHAIDANFIKRAKVEHNLNITVK